MTVYLYISWFHQYLSGCAIGAQNTGRNVWG